MLSDEEKYAIDYLKIYIERDVMYENRHYKQIEIILNLIEKQSKEIEELKRQIPQDKIFYYSEKDYTSNDKIKAKIEELDEEIKVKKEIARKPMDRVSGRLLSDNIVELEKIKKVLQSLLEKE